jgi:hypothetical protein
MAAKTKGAANRSIELVAREWEAPARTVARCLLDPTTGAAHILSDVYRAASPDADINGFVAELQAQATAASDGNLGRSEAMLVTQAHTLDALFHSMVGRSRACSAAGDTVKAETYMRLALKAQSQCRTTIEALAEIKNPPVVYARQANFAAGHQQVLNNGAEPSRIREIENAPTKLLEAQHGERLDTGTASTSSGVNQTMEALGKSNRTANGSG